MRVTGQPLRCCVSLTTRWAQSSARTRAWTGADASVGAPCCAPHLGMRGPAPGGPDQRRRMLQPSRNPLHKVARKGHLPRAQRPGMPAATNVAWRWRLPHLRQA